MVFRSGEGDGGGFRLGIRRPLTFARKPATAMDLRPGTEFLLVLCNAK